MSKDTEIDMKEVELNDLDLEKQPITGDGPAAGGEKNGSVKQKVPEDEVTFTGLSKEELMKVAGTPGWVRTRWVLLVLFWLGWVGMLAGAIVIIVQAPRCKPIPEMNWWNEGPLYQISDVKAFADEMKGIENKLDTINQLKVKGLVLGPFHTVQADQPDTLNFEELNPVQGSKKALVDVVDKAHKKGISVVLDLTPNYLGTARWFSTNVADVMEKVKAAAEYWLSLGVDGIKVPDLAFVAGSAEWSKLQDAVQANRTNDSKKRVLMGVVENMSATEVSQLVNTSGVDLILSNLLSSESGGMERIQALDTLNLKQRSLGWGLGATQQDQLSKWAVTPALIRLYQLLLFTMPGTPVFTYGDEIGLRAGNDSESPKMVWDIEEKPDEGAAVNETAEAERQERTSIRKWFISLSDLRGKERSLLHGDYYTLYSSASSLSFLRLWDQSERYITAVNWGTEAHEINFTSAKGLELPETAKVKLSTDEENLKSDSTVSLDKIKLGPGQAVLLQFPYKG
uniref:solute carrier family 3 member 2a n=1 Tax=Scatophagus argus TaxID=75038 RepID=UPI001ED818CB|nr:solute carrier family 3 member 2a [Scatophagus argus]XP_046236856.1 solute carrier family 3 member 2a [Scatophagus argus]